MTTDDKTHHGQTPTPAAAKDRRKDAKTSDEIQHFDTTVTKLVEREVEDDNGDKHTETVEVMSDNLYPGEKLKREADEEQADKKAEAARTQQGKDADKH